MRYQNATPKVNAGTGFADRRNEGIKIDIAVAEARSEAHLDHEDGSAKSDDSRDGGESELPGVVAVRSSVASWLWNDTSTGRSSSISSWSG